jgi:hypothetical protein
MATGGGATLKPGHKFYDTARLLVDLAIEANENGDYFPVSKVSSSYLPALPFLVLQLDTVKQQQNWCRWDCTVAIALNAVDPACLIHTHPQVQGTCLGMETLSIIISQNYTILTDFDAEDNGGLQQWLEIL